MKMIHAAEGASESRIWTPVFRRELEKLGTLEIIENAASCGEGSFWRGCGRRMSCWISCRPSRPRGPRAR